MLAVLAMIVVSACSDTETYADQKKKERAAISSYIAEKHIKVITEDQFYAQDSTTDVSANEYVLFDNTGIYMQIERKGVGEKIKNGETATVLCRFDEYNLIDSPDTLQMTNNYGTYANIPEKMTVTNYSGSFTASLVAGQSILYYLYSSTEVPTGWLIPLTYINVGRITAENSTALVRLIVPHSQGHSGARSSVYPCFYEMTYQKGR